MADVGPGLTEDTVRLGVVADGSAGDRRASRTSPARRWRDAAPEPRGDLRAVLEAMDPDVLPVEEIPRVLGTLERLKTELWLRIVTARGTSREASPRQERLLSADEAAKLLAMPRARLYELARQGRIEAIRDGPKYTRFRAGAIADWITQHRVCALKPGGHGPRARRR